MTLYATAGAKLYIGGPINDVDDDLTEASFSSQTSLWKEIKELDALGTLGDTSQAVTASIINRGRDYLGKGTRSAGTMEVVANIVTDDPGQLAAIAAERTPYDYAFRLVLPDTPSGGGTPSQRLFAAKVMSAAEVFDQANSLMKMNLSLGVNSNVVRVDADPT